ncbi:MAG: Fic family protein [Bacillota bacterium]
MKLNSDVLRFMKDTNMAEYQTIKAEFLYHSNKIEGSTFSYENLLKAIDKNVIEGNHSYNDIVETMNSTFLFDFIVDTIDEEISERFIKECHSLLTKNTLLDTRYKQSGKYKIVDNALLDTDLQLTSSANVAEEMALLLQTQTEIVDPCGALQFHVGFEKIHPFLDGNGRIGRFLLLKQCIMKELDIFVLYEQYEKEYKAGLYEAQKNEDYAKLNEVCVVCVSYFEERMQKWATMLKGLEERL